MKPLTLTALEVRALLQGDSGGDGVAVVELWREIKPQPNEHGYIPRRGICQCDDCGDPFRRAPKRCKCGCTLFKTMYIHVEKACPWPIDSEWWVRETWGVIGCGNPRCCPQGSTAYRADDKPWGRAKWRAASRMPAWASRLAARVVSVAVERDWGGVWSWRVGVVRVMEEEKR